MLYYIITTGNKLYRGILTRMDGSPVCNEVIPEFYYRKRDLQAGAYIDLGQMLSTGDTFFDEYLKGKYIVVGNFETDLHETYLGKMPGTLILWDTYLTLLRKPPVISISWLIVSWLYYFFLSSFLFIKRKPEWYKGLAGLPLMGKLLTKYISWLGALILLSLISLVCFNIFISLFYISFALTLISVILERRMSLKEKVEKILE